MNVLLTCAGRRNYLVDYFKQALGKTGAVIACDRSADAPAFLDADRCVITPSVDHPQYFEVLAAVCREQAVGLLIAVHELEIAGLAARVASFRKHGTIPVISAPAILDICRDKWQLCQFLRACEIGTPATYRSIADVKKALACAAIRYPLVIKPRWGVSSIGVERIDNDQELALAVSWAQMQLKRTILAKLCHGNPQEAFIFQEWLPGDEYGMDIVNNLDGRYVATLARRKLAMRTGNTDRAVTVNDPGLERLGAAIGARLGHVGNLDCDLIATPTGWKVIDLNPRFGGGYPFSHVAGANVPAALIAWAAGQNADSEWFRPQAGIVSSKYDRIAVLEPFRPGSTFAKAAPCGLPVAESFDRIQPDQPGLAESIRLDRQLLEESNR